MSFHFRSIRLKDWLVYGGETELRFPEFQDGRNLVVVNGQNGFGKTSLLRALEFVFHGRDKRPELIELWNEKARAKGEGTLEVALEFLHGGHVCKLVRGADFKPWGNTVAVTPWVKLFIDGTEDDRQVPDKIEQLLPKECLEFLFFDGAEISRYAQKHQSGGVRDAIEKVLGIPAVRNLRDDLGGLVGALEDEQERLLSATGNAAQLSADIESLKVEEETYTERRADLVERKAALESTKRELEAEAEGIDAIERERNELEEKRRRRATLEERHRELDAQIQQLVSRAPLYLLEAPLRQIVEQSRAQQTPSVRRDRQQAQLQVLRQILEDAKCLCGRDVDHDLERRLTEEVNRLDELAKASGARTAGTTGDLVDLAATVRTLATDRQDGEEIIDRRATVAMQMEEIDTDIDRLRKELEGHDLVSVKELYEQIGVITHQLRELAANIASVDENLARIARDREVKQRERDKLGAGSDQARGVTRTLAETRKVHAAVTEYVERLIEEKRAGIEDCATEIFRMITNKPDEYEAIRLRPDYTLEVLRKDGSVVENEKLSAGEKEVVAYSFITALNLSSVDPAPFVMDTPFGHLDAGHRTGLLHSLPRLKVQAILLATDRDLPPNERDAINGSIAKEFVLRRDQQRALTLIEEC